MSLVNMHKVNVTNYRQKVIAQTKKSLETEVFGASLYEWASANLLGGHVKCPGCSCALVEGILLCPWCRMVCVYIEPCSGYAFSPAHYSLLKTTVSLASGTEPNQTSIAALAARVHKGEGTTSTTTLLTLVFSHSLC